MWGVLQETARLITLVLDGNVGSSRKCPRCKGSGLYENSFTWLEKNGAQSNQPCWFCEGIGALPIVGLTGFVLARTTPCLQALDNKIKKPPVQLLEQSHVRYGKETCKFTKTKLGLNLVDLSFDYTRSPWLHYASLGSQQNVCVESNISHVSEPRQQPLSSSAHKDLLISTGVFQRLLRSPLVLLISGSHSNTAPSPFSSLLSSLQPKPALAMAAASHQDMTSLHRQNELRSGFTIPYVLHPWKSSYCSTASISDEEHQGVSALSHQCVTKLQSQTASSVLFSAKERRRRRKARNCIRSKARKEAQERAGRIMRSLKHKVAQDSSPNACILPEDGTSQSFQGLDAQGGGISPSSLALRLACLMSVAVRVQSCINRLGFQGFKALIPIQCQSIPS